MSAVRRRASPAPSWTQRSGGRRRRRAQVGEARPPARTGDGVPAAEVVAAVGQALDVAVVDGDPPQLVRPRRSGALKTMDRPSGAGQSDVDLALRDVAVHRRAGHQVVAAGQVPTARRAGLGPVGREQVDVVAAAAATLQPMAERGDGRPVGQPGRRPEDRPRTARDRRDPPARDVHDVDRRVATRGRGRGGGSRRTRCACRPGDQAGSSSLTGPSVRRDAAPVATSTSHRCFDLVVEEAGAVEHVVEPVDEPIVGRRAARRPRGLALLPRRRASSACVAAVRRADDHEPRAVRRPLEPRHAARAGRSGAAPRRRTVERQQVDLLRCPRGPSPSTAGRAPPRRAGRRSDRNASVRPSGEKRGCQSCRAPIVSWRGAGASGRRRSRRARARAGSHRTPGATVCTTTTAQRPSGDRRGSVAMRRR